ncbi:MAG: zinc-dependent metalloprotease [Pontimonas sp.]
MAEPDEREEQPNPEDWIRDAVHKMFQGNQGFDPEELAKAAGFTGDPAQLQAMVEQFAKGISGAINNSDQSARDHAVSVAAQGATSVDPARAEALARAMGTAALWLNSATDFAEPEGRPLLMSRQDWARATLPVWQEMAEPVAKALAEAIANLMKEQGPEEVRELLGSSSVLVSMTTGLFKLQLSQVVGGLAKEVLSAGDIGIPLLHASSDNDVRSGLVPQNMDAFSEGLGIPGEEVDLYLAIRELAHQRLFRHARWLRNHVLSLVGDFARGIHIDGAAIMDLAESLNPNDPDEISRILSSGALLPERTEAQNRALERLETMLALIEGWVDHVTQSTAHLLPNSLKIAEAIRRRRATGGPAEHAFKTLVGLELRPRRLREASALWAAIDEQYGSDARDALWSHPDHLPTEEDLDQPENFLARMHGPASDETDVDKFLDNLFGDENPPRS